MDKNLFFEKIYTAAFRLTGEEQIAEEMAAQAIVHTFMRMDVEYTEKITEKSMLQLAIIELVKIFLNNPNSHCNESLKGIQKALLKLKPINRVIVIWKDVLGYKIHDNIPISNYTYEELYKELVCGRKELVKLFSAHYEIT